MIECRTIAIRDAKAFCDTHHSHHSPPVGGLFAMGAFNDSALVCIAMVSRPVARALDNGSIAEVTRLASDGTTRGASSALLKACVVEAAKRGYSRVVSYTLLGEVGACYRAARWRPVAVTRGNRQWSCPSRPRRSADQPGRKVRWEAGADAMPRSMEAQWWIDSSAGKVCIPTRQKEEASS